MLRVGLTGGIACGKSHVLRRLAGAGVQTLDLDRVSHDLTAPGGAAHAEVVRAFGASVLTPQGALDRRRLGALVFADPAALAQLNAIVHPHVRREEERRAAGLEKGSATVLVTDAALLVEAGVHLRFDRLVVVHCAPEQQLARLMARDGLDEASARARIAAQMPLEEKRLFAHLVIDTSGDFAATDRQVDAVGRGLEELSARVGRPPFPAERAAGCLFHGPRSGPGGLTPEALIDEAVAARGIELQSLAGRMFPRDAGRPWYRLGVPGPGPGPEALAGALVSWCLTRNLEDADFVLGAAASLGWLCQGRGEPVAAACLAARALFDAAIRGTLDGIGEQGDAWSRDAERWARAAPPQRIARAFAAARRHSGRPEEARREAGPEAGDLAAALVGMAEGLPSSRTPEPISRRVRALAALPG